MIAPADWSEGRPERPEYSPRLQGQLGHVFQVLADSWRGRTPSCPRSPHRTRAWWTVPELVAEVRARFGELHSETGLSARLRDLRKPQHGGHRVPSRPRKGQRGLYEYRLELPEPKGSQLELQL